MRHKKVDVIQKKLSMTVCLKEREYIKTKTVILYSADVNLTFLFRKCIKHLACSNGSFILGGQNI